MEMEETHTPERTVPAIDQEIRGNQAAIDRMNQTRKLALDCGADAVLLDRIAEYIEHRRGRIDQLAAEKADLIDRVNALPSDSVRGVMTARIIDGLTFEKAAEMCCYCTSQTMRLARRGRVMMWGNGEIGEIGKKDKQRITEKG